MHFRRLVPLARGSRMFGPVGTGRFLNRASWANHGVFRNTIANAPYGLDELFRRIDLGELFTQATNIDHDCIVRRRRVFLIPYVFEPCSAFDETGAPPARKSSARQSNSFGVRESSQPCKAAVWFVSSSSMPLTESTSLGAGARAAPRRRALRRATSSRALNGFVT